MLYYVQFPKPSVLPVIHCVTADQTVENVSIAKNAGADGVFLINHGFKVNHKKLIEFHAKAALKFPNFWMGINFLDLEPMDALKTVNFHMEHPVGGLWIDNGEVTDIEVYPEAKKFWKTKREYMSAGYWNGIYFGGVAFKYQEPVKEPALAAAKACEYMDIVCTSGPGTGEVADIDKIAKMKQALRGCSDMDGSPHALAIASGITPENVKDFLPYVDAFMVATGISKSFDELDPAKVAALVAAVHSYP